MISTLYHEINVAENTGDSRFQAGSGNTAISAHVYWQNGKKRLQNLSQHFCACM